MCSIIYKGSTVLNRCYSTQQTPLGSRERLTKLLPIKRKRDIYRESVPLDRLERPIRWDTPNLSNRCLTEALI